MKKTLKGTFYRSYVGANGKQGRLYVVSGKAADLEEFKQVRGEYYAETEDTHLPLFQVSYFGPNGQRRILGNSIDIVIDTTRTGVNAGKRQAFYDETVDREKFLAKIEAQAVTEGAKLYAQNMMSRQTTVAPAPAPQPQTIDTPEHIVENLLHDNGGEEDLGGGEKL